MAQLNLFFSLGKSYFYAAVLSMPPGKSNCWLLQACNWVKIQTLTKYLWSLSDEKIPRNHHLAPSSHQPSDLDSDDFYHIICNFNHIICLCAALPWDQGNITYGMYSNSIIRCYVNIWHKSRMLKTNTICYVKMYGNTVVYQ